MLTASRPHKTSLAAFCSLLAGLLTFSCGAGDPHDFALSWHFEDGRDCAETGVAEVEVTVTATRASTARFACEDGLDPFGVPLGTFEAGVVEVEAAALSGSGQSLYVGSGRVDLRPGNERALLELVFVRE